LRDGGTETRRKKNSKLGKSLKGKKKEPEKNLDRHALFANGAGGGRARGNSKWEKKGANQKSSKNRSN